MTSLRSLVRRGDTGTVSPLARRIAVGLAVLTPLLIAGVAVTALHPPTGAEAGVASPAATASPGATSPAPGTPSPTGTPSPSATPTSTPSDSATPTPTPSTSESATPGPASAPSNGAGSAVQPLLPAAVVNEDVPAEVTAADGTTSPAPIGKLLVSQLTAGTSGQGFSWTVTDEKTASEGLVSGQFAAVVTIPKDFSASYVSLTTSDPVQATLDVQTNAAGSYASGMLAGALSKNLQAAVSDQATTGFVSNTLAAFTTLHTDLGTAADAAGTVAGYIDQSAGGAGDLATGLTTIADEGGVPLTTLAGDVQNGLELIASGTDDLPIYANGVAEASAGITGAIGLLETRLAEEGAASYAIDARQQALEAGMAALGADVPTLTGEEIQERLAGLQLEAAGIRVSSFTVTLGLGLDALGVTALRDFSNTLTEAQSAFAADVPLLTSSLDAAALGSSYVTQGATGLTTAVRDAATGAGTLSGGLQEIASGQHEFATNLASAAENIPSYTDEQQAQLAKVVTNPIVTDQTDLEAPPSAAAAIAAVAVPLALWIGAFVIYLLLVPFSRRALDSTASTFRVVVSALAPAAVLAVLQAAVVVLVLIAIGAEPVNLAGSILFALLMSLTFVTLHQGLVALFGLAGRMLSLALVVVQVAAAAVIIPTGLSSPLYTGVASLLPLSHAISGMQALLGGGPAGVAAKAALVLVVFALIGLALSLVAARRQRSRDVVVLRPAVARA
jgi:putative membrane protein